MDHLLNNLKIVRVSGGVGNQMFQYAFARALLEKIKDPVFLDVETWFAENDSKKEATLRKYKLGHFSITVPELENPWPVYDYARTPDFLRLPGWARKLFRRSKFPHWLKDEENGIDAYLYREKYFKVRGFVYFSGYYQSELYFKSIRNILLKEFSLKEKMGCENEKIKERILSTPSVSLHVRRTDYLSANLSLDPRYYSDAIAYVKSHVPNPLFFIFSDDMEWTRKNICNLAENYITVNINDAEQGYCDLELMKLCKHNIIANSSLSWWGAWLNRNRDKLVVSPREWWHTPASEKIIPEEWIKI